MCKKAAFEIDFSGWRGNIIISCSNIIMFSSNFIRCG